MNQMSDIQVGYLAGIFDGEGWFITNPSTGPALAIAMTDFDVIKKLHEWSGVGRIEGPRQTRPETKPQLKWVVQKHDELKRLIGLILPHLSQRRSERAIEVLCDIETRKTRAQWRKVHFICGHEKVELNIYHTSQGKTICRSCSLAKARRQYQKE